jgi:hypothetical protein
MVLEVRDADEETAGVTGAERIGMVGEMVLRLVNG